LGYRQVPAVPWLILNIMVAGHPGYFVTNQVI